jgi:hypothetical protein
MHDEGAKSHSQVNNRAVNPTQMAVLYGLERPKKAELMNLPRLNMVVWDTHSLRIGHDVRGPELGPLSPGSPIPPSQYRNILSLYNVDLYRVLFIVFFSNVIMGQTSTCS